MRVDEESAQLLQCAVLESHSTYVRNEVAQTAPHHTNSYLYAQSRTRNVDEAGAGGELACFWVLLAQHGHKEWVANVHGKDYAKVVEPDVYLNDEIPQQLHVRVVAGAVQGARGPLQQLLLGEITMKSSTCRP